MRDAKRALRSRMRDVRRAIAADVAGRAERSRRICDRVAQELERRVGAPERVMVFEPLPTEPDLALLRRWCAARGIAVYVPEVDGEHLRVTPGDVDPASLDAVIVPGLAFTSDGERLGQGGGHYDRFLARVAPACVRIGVAFREQLVETIPSEAHDAGVDVVITD